jgi:hypothetical protein
VFKKLEIFAVDFPHIPGFVVNDLRSHKDTPLSSMRGVLSRTELKVAIGAVLNSA